MKYISAKIFNWWSKQQSVEQTQRLIGYKKFQMKSLEREIEKLEEQLFYRKEEACKAEEGLVDVKRDT